MNGRNFAEDISSIKIMAGDYYLEIRVWDESDNNITHVIHIPVLEVTTTTSTTTTTTTTTTQPPLDPLLLLAVGGGAVVVIIILVVVVRRPRGD